MSCVCVLYLYNATILLVGIDKDNIAMHSKVILGEARKILLYSCVSFAHDKVFVLQQL